MSGIFGFNFSHHHGASTSQSGTSSTKSTATTASTAASSNLDAQLVEIKKQAAVITAKSQAAFDTFTSAGSATASASSTTSSSAEDLDARMKAEAELEEDQDKAAYEVIKANIEKSQKGFDYLAKNHQEISYDDEVVKFITNHARGDARFALNLVENSYFASNLSNDKRILTIEILENISQKRNTRYSQQEHYDTASAFQKSLRGSDADAAIYYLAKMITAGEDPRFIARRLIVTASEDVGNADINALNVAINAYNAVELLGLPEGRIPLAQAVIYVAKAPKSNSAICAIDSALSDIESGLDYPPPMHLRDAHYKDASKYGFGQGYVYSHANPELHQQFLPDELVNKKYVKENPNIKVCPKNENYKTELKG